VVTRARRARALRRQFEQHARSAVERRLHTGDFIAHLRVQQRDHSAQTLLLIAADSGRLAPAGAHPSLEREQESRIASLLAESLAPNERLAVWRDGGFLALLGETHGEELDRRAEGLRERLAGALDEAQASVAIVPSQSTATSVADLIDVAERTLVLARHGGGGKIQRALTELRTELDADNSFVLQKALARNASGDELQFEYQPIVPLHGAVRPQFQLHLRVVGENGRQFTRRQWLEVARQIGCLTRLDRYLLSQTLDQVTSLRERYPSVRLVVAMAAESVISADFRKSLLFGLSQRGLLEPGLILTVDESEALEHLRELQHARLELAAARVGIGLGRTSIHPRAHQLIDALKPEWVAVDAPKMLIDPEASAVINHAHERGAEVVAHFIPDAPAMARLFALGVDYGIGSFIGPPGTEPEFDFGA
jgi:EAL domain-containing protein (putative c-di-GMP-specific phosphodiesterase class I)